MPLLQLIDKLYFFKLQFDIGLGQVWSKCTVSDDHGNQVATLKCLPDLFHNVVNGALVMAGVFAVGVIMLSGYNLVKSAGDAKKIESARQGLAYAIVGLIVVLGSFFIISIISHISNVNCINGFSVTGCAK